MFRWGGGVVQGGVQVGVFRWGFSGGGAKGQTLGGVEGEQRGKRWVGSSTESFCNLSLDFEID